MHLQTRVAPIPGALFLRGKCGARQNSSISAALVGVRYFPTRTTANAPMKMKVVKGGLLSGNAKKTLYIWLVLLITMGHVGRVVMLAKRAD